MSEFFVGIDVGTQGVRIVVLDESGTIILSTEKKWLINNVGGIEHEQNPYQWWEAICFCLQELSQKTSFTNIARLSLVATSGTLLLLDASYRPLYPALMWNDKRAKKEAEVANKMFQAEGPDLGLDIRPTFTIAKALWMKKHKPEIWKQTKYIVSAGDWLLTQFTGESPVTDFTNALKTGADLVNICWPKTLSKLGIDEDLLPPIVPPGTTLGKISIEVSKITKLPTTCAVLSGVTDAMGAQIASGAVEEGQWVTTIGTGLSIKGNTMNKISAIDSGLYSHRAWNGSWSISATSHCGGDSLYKKFPNINFGQFSSSAKGIQFSSYLVLPLASTGEYFPFTHPEAIGFEKGSSNNSFDLFLGYLEGIAFIERLAMDNISQFAEVKGPQISMGGGASNSFWLEIRAETLGRPTVKPVITSSAFGAGIIALAGHSTSISSIAKKVVRYHPTVIPKERNIEKRDMRYKEFLQELENLNYLNSKNKGVPTK